MAPAMRPLRSGNGDVSTAKILVVEDEPPLLELIERYLKRQGFEVEPHVLSLPALESVRRAPEQFDLVIVDLGLPDMPGDKLLIELLKLKPTLRGLICSGSEFFIANLPEALRQRVGFLQKPFLPKELAETVQRLLGKREAARP